MSNQFPHDVFLSHSAKDKAVVRSLAERLRQDGLRVWFDEWVLKPAVPLAHRMGEGSGVRAAKIEEGLEHSRVLVLCMSANAFGSDWAQLEAGTVRFRDPLNQERRFIPLRLDDAPIKGSLAQFLYINWRPADREQEYAKLLEACRHPANWPQPSRDSESLKQPPHARQNEKESTGGERESRWESCAHFFSSRFAKAFPGIRDEVVWFSDTENIASRMDRLLQPPLEIGNYSPIWWFRGLTSNCVERFRRLDEKTWLFNDEELQIGRIGAVENRAYWKSFVYVEVNGVAPSGAYDRPNESLESEIRRRGYSSEEVCLFRGRYLKRTFFDDGTAEINGQLVDLSGEAELRQRYLSKYNFVLTGQDSAINNTDFEMQLHSFMNGLLVQPAKFEQLVQGVELLPKQVSYFNGRGPYVE